MLDRCLFRCMAQPGNVISLKNGFMQAFAQAAAVQPTIEQVVCKGPLSAAIT